MGDLEEKMVDSSGNLDDHVEGAQELIHQGTETGGNGVETPLSLAELLAYLDRVPAWTATAGRVLDRSFALNDFGEVIRFITRIGELVQDQQHYPEIHIQRGTTVTIHLWTQSVNQLTTSDFIMAGRIDRIWQEMTSEKSTSD